MAMKAGHAGHAKRANRRALVAAALLKGYSNRAIAEMLKAARNTINSDVEIILQGWADDQKPEARHRWRALELEKLSKMEVANLSAAENGNQGAIDRALRIMERRAKILGLDAPAKQEVDLKNIDRLIEAELERITGRKIGDFGPASPDALGSTEESGAGDEVEDGDSPN